MHIAAYDLCNTGKVSSDNSCTVHKLNAHSISTTCNSLTVTQYTITQFTR